LARRRKPGAAIVLIDEGQLAFESVHSWMADPEWANVPFIGLSATPWTKGLGKHYDDLIIDATTKDLISQGYLSQITVFAPSKRLGKLEEFGPDLGRPDVDTLQGSSFANNEGTEVPT
jgi:DNA repair protein RadD